MTSLYDMFQRDHKLCFADREAAKAARNSQTNVTPLRRGERIRVRLCKGCGGFFIHRELKRKDSTREVSRD